MTSQNVKVNIDGGIVRFFDIQSNCIKTVVFNPWDDMINLVFWSNPEKVYTYHYNKSFQTGFVSRVGTTESLGSFVSLSLKELVRKN